ncbi:Riboflavin synthase [Corynebacterium ciconiae DSM 44920]|uniref:riboflavin synthase n=1 Tax=Corynebacterium ciconiae TaxID=227319 RepID=UPI00036394AE|nr:riboflavin synthase [Corynebacterium ciconiae]WKD61260.1 Riboflavin synthase [Corynebacterium ciconiae DSM 44920]
MFTGLVEEIGHVAAIDHGTDSVRLSIACTRVMEDATPGASISVNGVCLTVTDYDDSGFSVDVMQESLDRSSIGQLQLGDAVNLERAMAAGGRFGGHIVQGHVDAVATLISRTPGERWEVFRFSLPPQLSRYVVHKGSITVSGTSLTVSALGQNYFEVSLIPTTLQETILGELALGQMVNLEVDVIAKYVEKLTLGAQPSRGKDTED